MYHVRYGSEYIQDPSSETRRVITGQISEEVNEAPSFNFSIAPNHPALEKLKERDMDDFVTVTWEDDNGKKELFWGFIDEIDQSLNTEVKVYCKGNLALLQDMMLPPYSTAESETWLGYSYNSSKKEYTFTDGYDPNVMYVEAPSIAGFIENLLATALSYTEKLSNACDRGNSPLAQKLTLFDISYKPSWGTDLATECAKMGGTLYRSNSSVSEFWEEFQSKVLEGFGCFVYLWHDDYDYSWSNTEGIMHLALFAEVPDSFLNSQTVQFGKTITEYKSAQATTEQYNAVYVVGGEMPDTYKTDGHTYSEDFDDGLNMTLQNSFIYEFPEQDEDKITNITSSTLPRSDLFVAPNAGILFAKDLVEEQGLQVLTDTNSDATTWRNLVAYACNALKEVLDPTYSFEVNAVDCVFLGEGEHLSCNQKARVLSAPHDLDEILPVSKASIDITSPANTKYTFGDLPLSITKYYRQKQSASESKQEKAVKDAKEAAKAAEKKAQQAQDAVQDFEDAAAAEQEEINEQEEDKGSGGGDAYTHTSWKYCAPNCGSHDDTIFGWYFDLEGGIWNTAKRARIDLTLGSIGCHWDETNDAYQYELFRNFPYNPEGTSSSVIATTYYIPKADSTNIYIGDGQGDEGHDANSKWKDVWITGHITGNITFSFLGGGTESCVCDVVRVSGKATIKDVASDTLASDWGFTPDSDYHDFIAGLILCRQVNDTTMPTSKFQRADARVEIPYYDWSEEVGNGLFGMVVK